MRTLDPDLLRTLVAFADTGSLTRAARAVNRTASAVTAQMQRLEADLGVALLAPEGRGRVLTDAGRRLAGHGRRILEAHRDAWLDVAGAQASGSVRLGAIQDLAETALPDLLAAYATSHPGVRLDLRIAGSAELGAALAEGGLDVAVLDDATAGGETVARIERPMLWLSARTGLRTGISELPVALLDPPCRFRDAGIAALDAAGRPYRLAATSASPAGLRAAVRAGIAVGVRTASWLDEAIGPAPDALDLPDLPATVDAVRVGRFADPPARRLAELLASGLRAG